VKLGLRERKGAGGAGAGGARGRTLGQAQAQRVDRRTSLQMTRQLLRLSLYNIAFNRALFPGDCFAEREVRELESMRIYVLRPGSDPEVSRLLEWMEKGAFDALQRQYLRCLKFAVSKDEAGADLLEEYSFSFTYTDHGDVQLDIDCGSHGLAQAVAPAVVPTASAVKKQVCTLTRLLVSLMSTLEAVPDERHLQMELFYYDERTPAAYEPPFFCANEAPGVFRSPPFAVDIGRAQTSFHQVGIRVKSTLVVGDLHHVEEEKPSVLIANPMENPAIAAAPSSGQLALDRLEQLTLTLGEGSLSADGEGCTVCRADVAGAPAGATLGDIGLPEGASDSMPDKATWSDAETLSLPAVSMSISEDGTSVEEAPGAGHAKLAPHGASTRLRGTPKHKAVTATGRRGGAEVAPFFQSQETILSGKTRRKCSKALAPHPKRRRIAMQVV